MEKLIVATVLKPQGICGEIKVKVHCDSAEDISGLKKIYLNGAGYGVLRVRAQGEFAYLTLKGVADRNAAELLRGADIEADRGDLPALPDGRYYIADLTGCRVDYNTGENVGEVVSVTPAKTDIYTVLTPKGEISFPAADGVIESVDVVNKLITVNKKRFKEVSV